MHNYDFEYEIEDVVGGFKFITNFREEQEIIYRSAAEEYGLEYTIENETYNRMGNKINDSSLKAFYVASNINDLTVFWNVFDQKKTILNIERR